LRPASGRNPIIAKHPGCDKRPAKPTSAQERGSGRSAGVPPAAVGVLHARPAGTQEDETGAPSPIWEAGSRPAPRRGAITQPRVRHPGIPHERISPNPERVDRGTPVVKPFQGFGVGHGRFPQGSEPWARLFHPFGVGGTAAREVRPAAVGGVSSAEGWEVSGSETPPTAGARGP